MNAYLLLNITASIVPDHEAVTFEDRRYTYEQLTERVGRLATALQNDGIKAGDRIGIIATNSPEVIETFFAAFQLGAGVVPINYRAKPDELAFMLKDSEVKLLIIQDRYTESIQPFLQDLDSRVEKTIVIGTSKADYYEYEQYIANVEPMIEFADVEDEHLAILLYTSGTTSLPKGVMMTYSQLSNYVMSHTEAADGLPKGASLTCVPSYHVAGATSICNCIYGGRRIVLIRQFEAQEWLATIEKEKVTHAFLVPTMLKRIIDDPKFDDVDFSHLQSLSYGAAPMPFPVILKAIEKFPQTVDFANAFGMTETTSTVSVLGPEDHKLTGTKEEIELKIQRLHSVGKPVEGVEVKILTDTGEIANDGEVGHIYLRTARAMKGYWNRPEASAETVVDGWINTKDMGWLDQDGYLFLTGRNSDMIIRGGENISPQEIENVLLTHPQVSDVAVIGLPSLEWGEEVLAVLVPKNIATPPSFESLREHCRSSLASFKCPSAFEIVPEIPRTSSGKILKKDLRDQYANDAIQQ
ncbi:MAG: class I adenylate-forming enzyme family protein [Lysinibacillus sp.]